MPELSVIIPVFNAEKDLSNCLCSILKQTYKDFELILVDDGSKDNSGVICENFARNDSRIKVFHKENGGSGSARNFGLNYATGEYVTFPDADDICKPDMFQNLVECMQTTKSDLVICSYDNIKIDTNGKLYILGAQKLFNKVVEGDKEVRELWFELRKINISLLNTPWNKLYKRQIIIDNNLKFLDLKRAQDAVFNLKYYNCIKSVCVIDKCLYQYNNNDAIKKGMKFPQDAYKCFLEYNRIMEETISQWGLYYGEYKALCDNNLLGNIDNCVCLSNNPIWGLNNKQKIDYLKNIMNDEYLQKRLQEYNGNVKEIEDIYKPLLKKNPRRLLLVLQKREFVKRLRDGMVGKCWRKVKSINWKAV